MKIIQLLARIEGSGVTRYIIELNKALVKAGHDVEICYLDPGIENGNAWRTGQTIDNYVEYDWSENTINHINSADLVIINSIIALKAPKRDEWIDLVTKSITVRKVIVVNDHKTTGFRAYYGDLLKRPDFWLAFDKICTFSYTAKVYSKIRQLIGEEAATKRFMHLLLPFEYDHSTKEGWASPDPKYNRVCYLGRHSAFKDETRLVRGCNEFWDAGFELEMRGVRPALDVITIPDFKYVIDPKTKRPVEKVPYVRGDKYELSPYTHWCDEPHWREKHGITKDDPMVYYPDREKRRIYIYSAYKREEGLNIISLYTFGCDFFHLDDETCYGNDLEYTIYEMVQYGTIPLIDYGAAEAVHKLQYDGTFSELSFKDLHLGIPLKKDLSNIKECLQTMNDILNIEYEEYMEYLYQNFKEHCNPKVIVEKFITDALK